MNMNPETSFEALNLKLERLIAAWKEAKMAENTCSDLVEAYDAWDIFQNMAHMLNDDILTLIEYGRLRRDLITDIQDKMEKVAAE